MPRTALGGSEFSDGPVKCQSAPTRMTLRSHKKRAQSQTSPPISEPPETKIIRPRMSPKKKARTPDTRPSSGSMPSFSNQRSIPPIPLPSVASSELSTPSICPPLPHLKHSPPSMPIPDLVAEDGDGDQDYLDSNIPANVNITRRRAFIKLQEEGFYEFSMKENLKEFEAEGQLPSAPGTSSSPAFINDATKKENGLPTPRTTPSGVSTPSLTSTSSATEYPTVNLAGIDRLTRRHSETKSTRVRKGRSVTTRQQRRHDLTQDMENVIQRHLWAMQDIREGMKLMQANAGLEQLAPAVSEHGTEEYRQAVQETSQILAEVEDMWQALYRSRPREFGKFRELRG